MKERHTLFHRPILADTPEKVRDFGTYAAALSAGMQECGGGKFWVDSEHQKEGATKWTQFVPPQPTMLKPYEIPVLEPEDVEVP